MSSDPNTSKKKFGPYNIEVTNEECVFLYYMANLMLNAISGLYAKKGVSRGHKKVSLSCLMHPC
jgi:hypothetical protein